MSQLIDQGGTQTFSLTQAAITAGNVTVKNAPGRLCTIVNAGAVTAVAALSIFDNATAASGTVIAVIPIGFAVAGVQVFNMPAASGITVGTQAAFTGGPLTISFS
jgi:hypothetical protein